LLPTKTLNWFGRVIRKNGASTAVSMFSEKMSKETHLMHLVMNAEGGLKGKIRNVYTNYKAYNFRRKNNGADKDDYLGKLENDNNGMNISNY